MTFAVCFCVHSGDLEIKAALLLIKGAKDVIAPIEPTRAMQRAIERASNPPRILVDGNEGHGFRSLAAQVEGSKTIIDYLNARIGAQRPPR